MMAHPGKNRFSSLLALASLVGMGAAMTVGCGDEDRPGTWTGRGDRPLPVPEACTDGATRDCHVTLSERNGILTCLNGSQTCAEGYWAECSGGTLSEMAAPPGYDQGLFRAQAVNNANGDCDPPNPCDPSCQQLDDDDELTPPEIPGGEVMDEFDYERADLAGFPGGLVTKAWNEPCSTAQECQFDSYCYHPARGDCDHNLCEEGVALEEGCDWVDKPTGWQDLIGCVDSICATGAGEHCCEPEAADACEHDPCVQGDGLNAACDPCVAQICAADADCCGGNDAWDATCVARVVTTCGNTCECDTTQGESEYNNRCYRYFGGSMVKWPVAKNACPDYKDNWHLATITNAGENSHVDGLSSTQMWIGVIGNDPPGPTAVRWEYYDGSPLGTAYTSWAVMASTPVNGNGVYMNAMAIGTWSHAATSGMAAPSKYYACEGPGSIMNDPTPAPVVTYEWDEACVDLVYDVCGSHCDGDASDGIDEAGVCQVWKPGETDEACDGVNLTVAPICERDENDPPTPSTADDTVVIPVCNHGDMDLTADFYLLSFGGYSGKYPLCQPEYDIGNPSDTLCLITTDIPAGQCIEVTDCDVANTGGVVVNPYIDVTGDGVPDNVDECSCLDNWSLAHDGECGQVCGEFDGFYPDLVDDCTLPIPDTEYGESDRVTITHFYDNGTGGDDDPVPFVYVGTVASCTNQGWYYSGSNIVLCPAACTAVNNVALNPSKLHLQLSCEPAGPSYEETSYVYTYLGKCGDDQGDQWMDLVYTADVPTGTAIQFHVATAASEMELPTDPTDPAWNAVTPSDLGAGCPLDSPCDIYQALGGLPDAQLLYLALKITLVPSADGSTAPTLNSWNITYSCPYNQ